MKRTIPHCSTLACLTAGWLLTVLTTFSADRTWTGAGGDSNWNNAANWNGGLPGTADKAIIATAGVSVT